MNNKICHITTVHPRYDVRIFQKECKSLSKHFNIFLIVADGLGDEVKDNVHIIDIGLRQTSRLKRAKIDSKKALKKALELNCELYHFHDPELIKIGLKLKRKGKKVIYDVHEDIPRQILSKPYIHKLLRPIISFIVEKIENNKAKQLDGIATSTPFIRNRFLKINKQCIDINNFPIINDFSSISFDNKKNQICYVGGLSENRGTYTLIKSLKNVNTKLILAGKFESADFQKKCESLPEWSKVDFLGFVNRSEIKEILRDSKIGMVNLKPLINYLDALPVKMFEYMSAGIPVIASDFVLWQEIVESSECGICVNPEDEIKISDAIQLLINNPKNAERMGLNGQKSVQEQYNWKKEEQKLFTFYKEIFSK